MAKHQGLREAEANRVALRRAVAATKRSRLTAIGVGRGPGDVAEDVDRHLEETGFGHP